MEIKETLKNNLSLLDELIRLQYERITRTLENSQDDENEEQDHKTKKLLCREIELLNTLLSTASKLRKEGDEIEIVIKSDKPGILHRYFGKSEGGENDEQEKE